MALSHPTSSIEPNARRVFSNHVVCPRNLQFISFVGFLYSVAFIFLYSFVKRPTQSSQLVGAFGPSYASRTSRPTGCLPSLMIQ
jgi:hypothetical protein